MRNKVPAGALCLTNHMLYLGTGYRPTNHQPPTKIDLTNPQIIAIRLFFGLLECDIACNMDPSGEDELRAMFEEIVLCSDLVPFYAQLAQQIKDDGDDGLGGHEGVTAAFTVSL